MLLDEKAALWLLGGLCDAFRVPFERNALLGAAELPYTEQKLFQIGRRLGFRFDFTILPEKEVRTLPLPCVLFLKMEAGESTWATPSLVMGEDERHLLYFLEGESTPCVIAADRLSEVFGPFGVLVSHDDVRSSGCSATGVTP
jgi:hypothetical protein